MNTNTRKKKHTKANENEFSSSSSSSLQQPIDRLIAMNHLDIDSESSARFFRSLLDRVCEFDIRRGDMAEKNLRCPSNVKMATTLKAYAQLEIDNSSTCIPR